MLKNQLQILRNSDAAFLPESQLSVFIHFMQIDFKYMHPILSGNQVSNRNKKNGVLSTKNVKFRLPDSPLFVGI
jgi:hypothetical protein